MEFVNSTVCPYEGCGFSPFPIHPQVEKRLRRSHENFYCPAGHRQSFPQKSDLEILEAKNKTLSRQLNYAQGQVDSLQRTCQWIWCHFKAKDLQGLATHMRAIHGMPTLAIVREEAS